MTLEGDTEQSMYQKNNPNSPTLIRFIQLCKLLYLMTARAKLRLYCLKSPVPKLTVMRNKRKHNKQFQIKIYVYIYDKYLSREPGL